MLSLFTLPTLRCAACAYLLPKRPTTAKAKGFFHAGLTFYSYLCSRESIVEHTYSSMDGEKLLPLGRKQASERICLVSSFLTELLELRSEESALHILFITGNPGVVSFYKEFLEALYELLDGNASITAIGHIAHTKKNWERGRMFSLQEQINHKVDFIKQELQSDGPLILVGHSIGAYIAIEVFKRLPKQVKFAIGLYPFLATDSTSLKQSMIAKITRSSVLSASISSFVSLLGFCPAWVSSGLIRRLFGQTWSSTAVDATCSHLLQYHTLRNVFFMAMTEFEQNSKNSKKKTKRYLGGETLSVSFGDSKHDPRRAPPLFRCNLQGDVVIPTICKFSEEPDLSFMKSKQDQIALLYGRDDHWGPLSVFEKISRQSPGIMLSIEEKGYTHAFCCTEAGSIWVARYVASFIKGRTQS